MIPELVAEVGALPIGRYLCTVEQFRASFVDHQTYAMSTVRGQIFDDWMTAKGLIDQVSPDLVEAAWVGGSFVTNRVDPDDIDSMFLINGPAFDALPSNSKRNQIRQLNRKGWLRETTGLRVESFILIRTPIANPWSKGGVCEEARDYLSIRGGWDDWWLRVRSSSDKTSPPAIEDAEPRRGYLEVIW